jgi:hypothetical protein
MKTHKDPLDPPSEKRGYSAIHSVSIICESLEAHSRNGLEPGTCKWQEIFRIYWGCSEEATAKFSALYHAV